MSEILVFAFRKADAAFAAGEALARLQHEAGTARDDIVVVVRDEADSVNVSHLIDKATGRPLDGGQWGMVIGLMFLADKGGAGVESGLARSFRAAGLEAGFLAQVGKSIANGGAAVGMRRRMLDPKRIEARVNALGGNGTLIRARLEAETEERLMDLQDQIPAEVLAHVQHD